jgi:hypothetical protein
MEDNAPRLDDEVILRRATALQRTVYSQDEDFLTIAHRWLSTKEEFCGVIYSHQRGITIGQAVADLEIVCRVLEPADMLNTIIYLPLR